MRLRTGHDTSCRAWHLVGIACQTAALVLLTASALVSDRADGRFLAVAATAIGLLIVTAVVMHLVGGLERRGPLICWPILVCVTAGSVGLAAPEVTSPVPGILTLSFAYVGLCLPPNRAWWLLPFAVPALVAMLDLDVDEALLRVPLSVAMWMVIAELPARLLARMETQRAVFANAARTDALTGLLNRSTMHEALDGSEGTDAVVLIDLDRFKVYNDTYGHSAGDTLLAAFASTLQECCAHNDRVYRYGGEEFLLVLPRHSPADAEALVTTVKHRWAAVGSGTTFSAGVAPGGPDALRLADARMYRAKDRA